MTKDAITELDSADRAGWMRTIEVAARRTMALWDKGRIGINGGSLRVGSGSATGALGDGSDGLIIADGVAAGLRTHDRSNATKYITLLRNGSILLNDETGTAIWTLDPTTGIYTLQTAWTAPTLLNSWVNFGSTFATAAYCRDHLGFVHIRGLIKSGTQTANTILFALPTGFRPLADQMFSASNTGGFLELRVASGGNVTLGSTAPSNTYLSLDMHFSTA